MIERVEAPIAVDAVAPLEERLSQAPAGFQSAGDLWADVGRY